MIYVKDKVFILNTKATTYGFRIIETGQPEHLYYGRKIRIDEKSGVSAICGKPQFAQGNTIVYDEEHTAYTLESLCLEMSSIGKGDIREPFISVIYSDGSSTSDFLYDSYMLEKGCVAMDTLPSSYDDLGTAETLILRLKDQRNKMTLELLYTVFEECDVIVRKALLYNEGENCVTIKRLMSAQVDFPGDDFVLTEFRGAWAREMSRYDIKACAGKFENGSRTGTSSNRANPFIMLSKEKTSENEGPCYGFNLIYSGNHCGMVEVNGYHKTRVLTGIQSEGFSYELNPGEKFETPEAVMSYGHYGFNSLSQNMHSFIREHIVRGEWKKKPRPVLLNSWEAAYFNINEHKLVNFAKKAKEVGIELFVMDDGWFGERNDDASSLGDWTANSKKLPHGLKGLCDKINATGLDFGIWVEPEMVNVKSKLYEAHPDWCIAIPGAHHSEGRNQRILDLSRTEVQDYIIEAMTEVFSSANIAYVKWDMNRIFSDVYSEALPASRQGEVSHRYVCGLYYIMQTLTERFPKILFEGCSSGGNRFDLGILCFFPQIWGSDNTDAITRAVIQNGYSYGYPQETVGAHVSGCPNHQTLRITPLETRFAVASFANLGYECNLCDMNKEDIEAIKVQIALYKQWRDIMQFGSFYRGRSFDNGNLTEWTIVSKDQKKAVGMVVQKLVEPNQPELTYYAKGLREDTLYHFTNRILKYNVKGFGDLVNTVAPFHVKPDSLVHNVIARMVKMDGEQEDCLAYGDTLMEAGIVLSPGYAGTGYNDKVRYFQDFGARMYFMESEE